MDRPRPTHRSRIDRGCPACSGCTSASAEEPAGSGKIKVVERTVDWDVAETAIIVCDMWDDHHCKIAAQRVGVMAPRMNQVLTAARDRGVMIIFAPSETMNIYAGSPHRKRMEQAKPAKPPVPIEQAMRPRPGQRAGDAARGHERSTATTANSARWCGGTRGSMPALDITGFDGISDNGQEIYNFCEQEGIKNIVLMGVHTNYCILARPFGIRQMLRLGKNVVLARDLTDALYDPRQPPHVSHARGTEIVVEHIETIPVPVDPERRPDARRPRLRRADAATSARPAER